MILKEIHKFFMRELFCSVHFSEDKQKKEKGLHISADEWEHLQKATGVYCLVVFASFHLPNAKQPRNISFLPYALKLGNQQTQKDQTRRYKKQAALK